MSFYKLVCAALCAMACQTFADGVPALITATATTTLDGSGRPWAYIALDENRAGLLSARQMEVFDKAGLPAAPGAFAARGRVLRTTDPKVIQVLLGRAAAVGENLTALEELLTSLHLLLINQTDSNTPPAVNPPAMPLNERLSALLNRAEGDASLAGMLDGIGLTHPAIRLARGKAWAGPLSVAIGADATLEVREVDGAQVSVLARVSVKAGVPILPPAPGPLAVVPDLTPQGDLNVKLRWATSAELRSAPYQGVLVWRVSRALAEAQGYQNAPPSAAILKALAVSNPAEVRRVTAGPVFPGKLFDGVTVTNFNLAGGDPKTAYVTDDNERNTPDGFPMPEGAEVYYFAAAVDALGQPGAVSGGLPAIFCRRLPPPLPSRLSVENAWTPEHGQYFNITWQQNDVTEEIGTARYEIYRGDDLAYHTQANNGTLNLDADPINPAHPDGIRRIAVVNDPLAAPAAMLAFADQSIPAIDANLGRTWWFAIRAIHDGPPGCGTTASVLSPPLFGALRKRKGPDAPPPAPVFKDCLRVACIKEVDVSDEVSAEPLDPSEIHFVARCTRRNGGISGAKFRVTIASTGEEVIPSTLVEFPEDEDAVDFEFSRPKATRSTVLSIYCQAVANDGTLSVEASSRSSGLEAANHYALHRFLAGAIASSDLLTVPEETLWASLAGLPADCAADRLLTVSPHTGRILPVAFRLDFTASSEAYRIYRRIDDGPLTLVAQGRRDPINAATIDALDNTPPTTCCTVTYYAQLQDGDGNSSPMRLLGTFRVPGPKPPAPVLVQPTRADFTGDINAPGVNLTWVCPPQGVERFEVFVRTKKPTSTPPVSSQGKLFIQVETPPKVHRVRRAGERIRSVYFRGGFYTARVGGELGAGPKFTIPLTLERDLEYRVWLRALGGCGELGEYSREIVFTWQPPVAPGPSVAWPSRPLPSVSSFNSQIAAIDFSDIPANSLIWAPDVDPNRKSVDVNETPIGIRVGMISFNQAERDFGPSGPVFQLRSSDIDSGRSDPNSQLYRDETNPSATLLPFVLYRQQIANSNYPEVSGAVLQCSPMIRQIAYRKYRQGFYTELMDPFFRWVAQGSAIGAAGPSTLGLYLVDTQPTAIGASYRYWLLHFDPVTGEPVQTIPCGDITVKENP